MSLIDTLLEYIYLSGYFSISYSGMLKAQKTNLVTETEYHNKEERVKVILVNAILGYIVLFDHRLTGCTRQRW